MPWPYDGPSDTLDNIVSDPTGQGKKPPAPGPTPLPGTPPTAAPAVPKVTYANNSNLDRHLSGGQVGGFKTDPEAPTKWVPPDANVLSPTSQLQLLQEKFHNGGYGPPGEASKTAFAKDLSDVMKYQPGDVKLIVDAADKARNLNIDPSRLQTAYEHGQLNRQQLADQLAKAGMPGDQIGIFQDMADDGKAEYTRTHAQDLANDANTAAGVENTAASLAQAERKRQYDASHMMTDGAGNSTEFTKTPSDNLVLGGYKSGQYDRNMAKTKLVNQGGYTDQDAETLLQGADNAQPAQQKQSIASPRSFGSGGSVNAAGGTRETHPQARQTVNDFRTNFASNLQSLGPAVTPAAREWAMNHQDLFFQPGSDSGSVGAAQVQNLYEGMGSAGGRAGYSKQGGAVQARAL